MLKSKLPTNSITHHNNKLHSSKESSTQAQNLPLMCKAASEIVTQLYNPLDAANRFINLALQSLEEDSLGRQFLIDSKEGLRKTSALLERLNICTKKIEKEIHKIERRAVR